MKCNVTITGIEQVPRNSISGTFLRLGEILIQYTPTCDWNNKLIPCVLLHTILEGKLFYLINHLCATLIT